jgi:hypothetical protein
MCVLKRGLKETARGKDPATTLKGKRNETLQLDEHGC